MSASSSAVSGVFSVGFSTMRLLVAIAGATLCATLFSGWLNGVIAEIAAERLARGVDAALLAVRGDVAGEDLAVVLDGELAGERIDVVGAADLVERVLLAQAGFGGDQVGDLVLALAEQRRRS